jgi:hypothetical protein
VTSLTILAWGVLFGNDSIIFKKIIFVDI